MTTYRLLYLSALCGSFACGGAVSPADGDPNDSGADQVGAAGSSQTGTGATGGTAGSSGSDGSGATGGTAGSSGSGGSGATGGTAGSSGSGGSGATGGTAGSSGSGGSGATGGTAGSSGSGGSGATGGTAGATGSGGSGVTGGTAGSGTGGAGTGGSAGLDGGLIDVRDADLDAGLSCNGPPHPVTFRLTTAGGFNYCLNTCNDNWLKITSADGGPPLRYQKPCNFCDAVCSPDVPLGPSFTYEWDGEVTAEVPCDAGFGWCSIRTCVAPGHYVATMCGRAQPAEAGACMLSTMVECVDVPFEYPPKGPVEGVIR